MLRDLYRVLGVLGFLVLALVAVGVIDLALVNRPLLDESPPDYSPHFTIRLVAAIILATLVAMASVQWNGGDLHARLAAPSSPFGFGGALVCLTAIAAATALLVVDPVDFHRFSREDSLFEWLSVLLLILASAAMIVSAVGLFRSQAGVEGAMCVLAGLIMFVIAMEEISWLQRVIGYDTPDALLPINQQREANLHNLATDLIENTYYGGVFLLLVLTPSMAFLFRPQGLLAAFGHLLPSRYSLVPGTMTTTFSYGMWNIFWMQFAFFFGVMILAVLAGQAVRNRARADALLFAAAAVLLIACNLIVLGTGHSMVRNWDDTEFKELVVALALFLYAGEVFLRVRRPRRNPEAS